MKSNDIMLNWGGVATMSTTTFTTTYTTTSTTTFTTTFTTTLTAMEETIVTNISVKNYEAMRIQFLPSRFAL